jgi:antitoxin (DNA-binding transcriptional repressor) of toxin-antitoxin stability system
MISITVTDAARGFSDLINRIRYRGESATLIKGGKPVARIVPAGRVCTGKELAKVWPRLPHLGADEARAMEKDLAASRRKLPAPKSKWD